MKPDDLFPSKLLAAMEGARIVFLDGRLHETASVVAKEVASVPNLFIMLR